MALDFRKRFSVTLKTDLNAQYISQESWNVHFPPGCLWAGVCRVGWRTTPPVAWPGRFLNKVAHRKSFLTPVPPLYTTAGGLATFLVHPLGEGHGEPLQNLPREVQNHKVRRISQVGWISSTKQKDECLPWWCDPEPWRVSCDEQWYYCSMEP